MNNNKYYFDNIEDADLSIAPQAFKTNVNPDVRGAEYWSLQAQGFASANFEGAWQYATGHDVTIGLVDEGVNYTHLDLQQSYSTDLDYDPRDNPGEWDALPDDGTQQHGTEVAGVIAGSATNTFGAIGAAFDTTITASYLRYGSSVSLDEISEVMDQQSGFDVANNSWGFTTAFSDNFLNGYFAGIENAIESAASTGRGGLGTSIVVAAGNSKFELGGENYGDDSNFHSLSNARQVIAVGAHDANGNSAFFSSPGTNVLISAPGVGLVTTSGGEIDSNETSYVSGTSFAAPLVSSAIALMLEVNPELGYRDIQEILAITARASTDAAAASNGAFNVNGGGMVYDREMGFGKLDAEAAVKLARHWDKQSTAANEQHMGADFDLPASFDPAAETLQLNIAQPASGDFSIDFVELTLDINDLDLKDLSIELVSPDGTAAMIAPNLNAAGTKTTLTFQFSSVETWGESPFGTWTLHLDHAAASAGFSVDAASLDVYGDVTGDDNTYYYTTGFAQLMAASAARTIETDGNGGTDTMNFAAADGGLKLDMSGLHRSSFKGQSFSVDGSFENAIGTSHNDIITGTDGINVIEGDGGKDKLDGGAGDDALFGGDGRDVLAGGEGADYLDGGKGFDRADYSHSSGSLTVDFRAGVQSGDAVGDIYHSIEGFIFGHEGDIFVGSSASNDWAAGRHGADRLRGMGGDDKLIGNGGNDRLDGGAGDDALFGGRDHDKLTGGGGGDHLKGGKGADVLKGGGGGDHLVGGKGTDVLKGDGGADVFIFKKGDGRDKVLDFGNGHDQLNLRGFHFHSHHQALKHFTDAGGAHNNRVVFHDHHTKIVIKGVDLHDLHHHDLLI